MSFIINKIEKLQFKKNTFKLYFENGNSLMVFADTIVKFALKPNIIISEKGYDELISYDMSKRVMLDALNLISKKAYSEKFLREKLIRKDYNADIVDKTLVRLKELNYLNDNNYAKNYALYLCKKGKGPFLIKAGLEKQEFDKDLIKEALSYIKEENEPFEVISRILKNKFKNFNNKDRNETKKVISFFLRRGFAFEDISKVIKGIVIEK
ncbi:MAG: RecX family transcriptional regulator [Endomicrobium sp.]|jgi:regulatory protein|nr:RecX family transcriptional regulator [Endomicrobium sp.]